MPKQISIFSAALFLLLCSIGHAEPADSPDQLRQMYTDGKYKELIPRISKALAVKGPDAAQYDKHDLLLLKGEASLRTHSKSGAIDAFKQAAAAATEANDIAIATATAELIKQANAALKYQPKTKTGKDDKSPPIDIVETDSRKLAFVALQADIEAVLKPKLDTALKSTKLSDVATESKDSSLAALGPVEIAATGSATDSKQMLGDLGHHAYAMMDGTLDKLIERAQGDVDAVNNRNKPVKAGQSSNNAASSKTAFLTEIKSIANSSKEISDYAVALTPLFGDTTDFKPLRLKVSQIETAVKDLTRQVNGQ